MESFFIKTMSGAMVPMDQDENPLKSYKVGAVVRCKTSEMRNGSYFRKWWALTKTGFDLWTETEPRREFKGMEIEPNFERFRKDVTILAGFFVPTFNVKGEIRLEAASLRWDKMKEKEFDALYQKTIDVILQKIIPHRKLSEEQLRDWAGKVLEFA